MERSSLRMTMRPWCLIPRPCGTSAALNRDPSANADPATRIMRSAVIRYDVTMRLCTFFAAMSFFGLGCSKTPAPTIKIANNMIFSGATVVSGSDQTPRPNYAVDVAGGRVVAVGPADQIRREHPGARVIDVTGATILPGLTDAHGHLYGLGLSLDTVNLVGATSYDEVIARVTERASRAQPGEWILGRGWDQNRWPGKQFPTAGPLDAAIADHPVWLRRVDGHAGVANSAAMRAAGVTASTPDPEGGRILRDANANPTGVFVDAAEGLIDRAVPPPSFVLRKSRVLAAARKIAENGLTEIHDPGADDETIRAVRELIDEKQFPIRDYTMIADNARALDEWFARVKLIDHGGGLSVRSVKLELDGGLGGRGVVLLEQDKGYPVNVVLIVC